MAIRTSLQLQPRDALQVTVANSERVPCPGIYRAAPFTIDNEAFTADFYALSLAGYDAILGNHWLASLRPILWDFSALTMSFWRRDHKVCWQGLAGPKALRVCSGDDMLQAMLQDFMDIFAEPTSMPSPQTRDHSINLIPGSSPVAVRPYRYSTAHKDELECQCAAMLAQGIV